MNFITYLASTSEATVTEHASGGILGALGIDLKLMIVQTIAFLVLVALLGKFVYPALIKMIESRRTAIEEGLAHAKKADEALARAEAKADTLLQQARKDADEIISRGQQEAKTIVADAETSAVTRAERIVADAHTQMQTDVQKAREALRSETVKLVAEATEQIIGEKLDAKKDESLITRALRKERA